MEYIHKELASGKWFKFSLIEQLANVGVEIFRAINYKRGSEEYSQSAFGRALELLDLTIDDPKNKKRLKELLRLREVLVDYFCFDNIYGSSDEKWSNYFFPFNYAARNKDYGGVA